ncbi:hypothetical protein HG719_01270 [Methanobacterium subterraneum]|uniref:Uncharacterized protein n=1 Tax=Methanobacterium subterraneum TaxID=59277 RepID=A0A7K4DKR1_9EURY|nr:hypothetical protein [Methanobacterium subterraneum]
MIILDNFRAHHTKLTTETAGKLNIDLLFLPTIPSTTQSNKIHLEKSERKLSPLSIKTKEQLRKLIEKTSKMLTIVKLCQKVD